MRHRTTLFCAALLIASAAVASASQDDRFDEAAVSNRVFSLLPALASSKVAEEFWAVSELKDLTHLKSNAPDAFVVAEQHMLYALRLSMFGPDESNRALAGELLSLLAEIGSDVSLSFLVENVSLIARPDSDPRDSPMFSTLERFGPRMVEGVLQRAVVEDDESVHAVLAALLVAEYEVTGALEWIKAVARRGTWDDAQLKRLEVVWAMIWRTGESGKALQSQ